MKAYRCQSKYCGRYCGSGTPANAYLRLSGLSEICLPENDRLNSEITLLEAHYLDAQ